jgi:UDP-N-acetylmuramoyl-L-alanyl-D-glutamate--2,6-diaminopimelate ligase
MMAGVAEEATAVRGRETMPNTTLGVLVDALGALAQRPIAAGARALPIGGVCVDSRQVRGGELFVALRGTAFDGHRFVGDAVERGAAAVVVEDATVSSRVPVIVVESSSKAAALAAARFHGDPARGLRLCGVTGTNGKTSTAHLVRSILSRRGERYGLIGTLGHGIDELVKDAHTTPDAIGLHRLFAQMRDGGCVGVVMEVSSHAVRQHRTWGLDFEVGILTNVTHDHLDYHPDMNDYRAAKAEFCYSLAGAHRRKPDGTLVYWADDEAARAIGEGFRGRRVAVGTSPGADCRVGGIELSPDRTRFALRLPGGEEVAIAMKLLGSFVPANAAVAAVAAMAMGASVEEARAGLEAVDRVPGRFESLGGGARPVVVIDYAHTPDGFERVLGTCRQLGPRRLVAVFGCGGDRDRAKRPIMGGIAQRLCDRCYLTTDNPRGERVETIVDDILGGMRRSPDVVVELDRARAIRAAISESGPGDMVAILGKGHEDYQLVGDRRLPWSDRKQAEEELAQWRAR